MFAISALGGNTSQPAVSTPTLKLVAQVFPTPKVLPTNSPTPVSTGIPTASPISLPVIYNLTPIVGKTIDQVKAIIPSKPTDDTEATAEQITLGTATWDKAWNIGGNDLLITYNINNRKVTEFFVGKDQDNTSANQYQLEAQYGVSEDSGSYSIKFVKANTDDTKMTGMIVFIN